MISTRRGKKNKKEYESKGGSSRSAGERQSSARSIDLHMLKYNANVSMLSTTYVDTTQIISVNIYSAHYAENHEYECLAVARQVNCSTNSLVFFLKRWLYVCIERCWSDYYSDIHNGHLFIKCHLTIIMSWLVNKGREQCYQMRKIPVRDHVDKSSWCFMSPELYSDRALVP